MMNITYQIKNAVYVNLTNRCPCNCVFCLRKNGSGVYGSGSLWLEREPTAKEVVDSLAQWDLSKYPEVVFCGYGEPTERLDTLLKIAKWLKEHYPHLRIRVNTNGLADLIIGEPTAHRFKGLVDTISISLNTPDATEYLAICRPCFGAAAYPAMLRFAEEAKKFVSEVVMTIVGEPVTTKDKQARCQAICDRLGVHLRIRPYEKISRS
ncbi:MAG: TatD family nuclease-associated radical SAM protein [Victivallales bacterium]|nr:TatD family nuclease-associated radical SAM protein [Victivallales bacterium]